MCVHMSAHDQMRELKQASSHTLPHPITRYSSVSKCWHKTGYSHVQAASKTLSAQAFDGKCQHIAASVGKQHVFEGGCEPC